MSSSAAVRSEGDGQRVRPQDLLRREWTQGYPADYLLARIRGRRSRLIRDWRPLVYDNAPLEHLASPQYLGFVRERTPEGMWRALLEEHGWLYRQMDTAVRDGFAAYFLYAELRTIFICLRHLERHKAESAGDLLGASLLAENVKSLLRQGEVKDAVAALGRSFGGLSSGPDRWAEAYGEGGLRSVERLITQGYLDRMRLLALREALRGFFTRIIDSRNILALYKALRGGAEEYGLFLAGGSIPVDRLQGLLAKDDLLAVNGLVRQAAGVAVAAPEPTHVELALYRGITRFLRTEGRDPLGEALLLDHLWRCQVEVMNLSMLLATKDLDREEVLAELVH